MPLDISALDFDGLIDREWLTTNGIGGYSCSTLCGMNTRKYHGLLVAAMSPPVRRMVLLAHVDEIVITSHGSGALSTNEYPGTVNPQGYRKLRAFSADPFPRWAFQGDGFTIEKSVHLLQGENTVCVSYCLLAGDQSVGLEIRPLMAMRPIHELTYQWNGRLYAEIKEKGQFRIPATSRTPEIFFAHDGDFHALPYWYLNTIYRREQQRGYAGLEDLWSPGALRWTLTPGKPVHMICSAEPVDLPRVKRDLDVIRLDLDRQAISEDPTQSDDNMRALFRAANEFVVSERRDSAGDVGVICQYPWSSPNGRSALIGFTGLFLIPGKFDQARRLLQNLASQLRDGLIPTDFPEDSQPPTYNGADTSLWFINAVGELAQCTSDEQSIRALLPAVQTIITAYHRGTKLGITCDDDGLIASRAPGIPTTWMDAKLGDWVVTPRAGRSVSLNALWFNALRIAANLAERFELAALATEINALADRVYESFNRRFWNPQFNCCYDVVEDTWVDASIRPNQILAMSLPHPVLADERRAAVLEIVRNELLTPMGLRSLAPRDSNYQPHYTGGVIARDRAQHQGSVYPWLLAPLATAYLREFSRQPTTILQIRQLLDGCLRHLQGDGIGQLPELFDGNAPHRPGGAIASAVSVAEILRCYAQDVLGLHPRESVKEAPFQSPARNPENLSTIRPD